MQQISIWSEDNRGVGSDITWATSKIKKKQPPYLQLEYLINLCILLYGWYKTSESLI